MTDPQRTDQRPTVLIVDDTPFNVQLLLEFLNESEYDARVSESGENAVKIIPTLKPDIILLDIMMPGMNGYQVLEQLNQDEETRDIPVIFMTALSETEDKLKGFRLGAVDYITKPLEHEEVLARLDLHLSIKRMQRQLQEQNRRLTEAAIIKDRFMQIANHDLRNPLSLILMAIELARSTDEDGEPIFSKDQALARIEMATRQMMAIVKNYLDIRKTEIGDDSVRIHTFFLPEVIRDLVSSYTSIAQAKRIHLQVDLPDDFPPVMGDRSRTHQVLTNYITNAIKYSPKETTITISGQICEEGTAARCEVRDQGPGVPPQERNRLFREFTVTSNKPTGGEASYGLGLWIAKKLTESQNGRAGAEFPESGGSVFYFELPVSNTQVSSKPILKNS